MKGVRRMNLGFVLLRCPLAKQGASTFEGAGLASVLNMALS